MHHESPWRSIYKAISWKVIASILAFSISYYFTGEFDTAGKTALGITTLGFIAYYFHERLWNKIQWGKERLLK